MKVCQRELWTRQPASASTISISCPATAPSPSLIWSAKLDMLRVTCAKCGRKGRYNLRQLVKEFGRDGKLTDWLTRITARCPRRAASTCRINAAHGARIYRRCCDGSIGRPWVR
jgi:hypothetical protein